MLVNGYRAMWLFVMFDLPVLTKPQRKVASKFRKMLVEDGFWMAQYSVYMRPCPSEDNLLVHAQRVKRGLPEWGHVRVLRITDKQFERMECYYGKKLELPENMPRQLELF